MKNTKLKLAKWICKLLKVDIIPPLISTINISNNNLKGNLDLSGGKFDKIINIDITGNPEITSISFPKSQISEKTTINFK